MSTIQKSYVYKVYDSGNTYLGNLPNVISDFSYTLDINTAGSTLSITCGVNVDVSNQQPPYLTTEDGTIITTEAGDYITTSQVPEIIATGDTSGSFLFRNGNKVRVYEISNNNVNGKIVFQGRIERLEATFGSDNQDEGITLLVYSDGTDLKNYVVPGSNALFVDQSQLTDNGDSGVTLAWAQNIIIGSGITNIAAVTVKLAAPSGSDNVTLSFYGFPIYDGMVAGTTPTSSTSITIGSSSPTTYQFIFPIPISVVPGQACAITLTDNNPIASVTDFAAEGDETGSYTAGLTFIASHVGGMPEWKVINGTSLYFETFFSDYTVDRTFTSEDPSTILKSVIDTYVSAGGLINYSAGTVDLTGISVTYTFSLATIYDAIQKCLELAPFGFYWYVDVGTNVLHFKQTSAGADLKLTKGTQINDLTLVMTTENVSNLEYFSGGNGGSGPNLFKQYLDQTSIQEYGPRLNLQSDNRVTLDATADTLGSAFIAENKDEQFQTTVTVSAATMDTTVLKPGLNVGFNGFGTFIDMLVLQIVEIIYSPEEVTMTLGRIPPRMPLTLQAAANAIAALQTIDNPSAPS